MPEQQNEEHLPVQTQSSQVQVPTQVHHVFLPLFLQKHVVVLLLSLVIVSVLGTTILAYLYFANDAQKSPKNGGQDTRPQGSVSISGTFDMNGQIPQGSNVTVLAKRDGDDAFNSVITNASPVDGGAWEWVGARANTPYDIQAVINAGGQTIAASNTITVVAPADSEVLRFNITSQPAATTPVTTTISGTIGLNGYVP